MAILQGFVNGQHLKVNTPSVMVSDTIKYITADFCFNGEAWNGLHKYAHFKQGDNVYDMELVEDHISADKGLDLFAGEWEVYVHGTDGVKRITTDSAVFTVKKSGMLNGDPFPSVTPSIGEQIVQRATEEADRAEEGAEEAKAEADKAKLYRNEAEQSEAQADRYAKEASTSVINAYSAYEKALNEADNAEDSANHAEAYKADSKAYSEEAKGYAESARQSAEEAKRSGYDDTEVRGLIADNAKEIEKVNETTSELSDGLANLSENKVGFTDYATGSKTGVFKIGHGLTLGSDHNALAQILPKETYNAVDNNFFISKGTLENLWNARHVTLTQAEYDALVSKDPMCEYNIVEE